ncbi:MAG: polysaccharide pyruvyl transferase family protein [Candidatus Helarchaeota archaeon]
MPQEESSTRSNDKILIINASPSRPKWSGNMGDLAIREVMLNLLSPIYDVTHYDGYINRDTIKKFDYLIIGGGGILTSVDEKSWNNFTIPIRIANELGKKVIMAGVGIDTNGYEFPDPSVYKIPEIIICRDSASKIILEEKYGIKDNVVLGGDWAMLLDVGKLSPKRVDITAVIDSSYFNSHGIKLGFQHVNILHDENMIDNRSGHFWFTSLDDYLFFLSSMKEVLTCKFHGVIFSILTNTPYKAFGKKASFAADDHVNLKTSGMRDAAKKNIKYIGEIIE